MIIDLPKHWQLAEEDDDYSDDGRDYNKPQYVRKDGLARIYHNENEEDTQFAFGISWDEMGDGDCCGSFEEAVLIADEYCLKHYDK